MKAATVLLLALVAAVATSAAADGSRSLLARSRGKKCGGVSVGTKVEGEAMAYAYGYALDTRGGIKSIPDECCSRCQLRAQLAADGETDPQGKPLSTCTLWSAAIRTTDGRQFVNCSFYPEGKVVKVKGPTKGDRFTGKLKA